MRRALLFPLLAIAATLLSSCGEPKADLANPKQIRKEPITLRLPGNWEVEDEMHERGIHHLSIETPGDAMVIVQVFPETLADDLKDYAKTFSAETSEAIPMGTMSGQIFTDLPEVEGWKAIKETLNIRLATVVIPHTRFYYSRTFGKQRCFVTGQVSTEDLDKVKSGFELVRSSLLIE